MATTPNPTCPLCAANSPPYRRAAVTRKYTPCACCGHVASRLNPQRALCGAKLLCQLSRLCQVIHPGLLSAAIATKTRSAKETLDAFPVALGIHPSLLSATVVDPTTNPTSSSFRPNKPSAQPSEEATPSPPSPLPSSIPPPPPSYIPSTKLSSPPPEAAQDELNTRWINSLQHLPSEPFWWQLDVLHLLPSSLPHVQNHYYPSPQPFPRSNTQPKTQPQPLQCYINWDNLRKAQKELNSKWLHSQKSKNKAGRDREKKKKKQQELDAKLKREVSNWCSSGW